mgnify:CR=1 FL=1
MKKNRNIIQDLVNYAIRLAIIILGFLILFNVFSIETQDFVTFRVIGGLMVVFGVYRIYSYYLASRKYRRIQNED